MEKLAVNLFPDSPTSRNVSTDSARDDSERSVAMFEVTLVVLSAFGDSIKG